MSAEDGFGVVAIIGVGLIGGSLGMALKRRKLAKTIIGVGRNADRLTKAVRLGAIDKYAMDFTEGCAGADVIVLCTPVSRIIADLPAVLDVAGPNTVVTDVGSVKSAIVEAAGGDPRFIGSHPMAGSEANGVESSREDLFDEATWIVTPVATTSPKAVTTARNLGLAAGASVFSSTPEAHDSAVAVISHLPHIMATSLMLQAGDDARFMPSLPAMSAASFADATRVAASSPDLWRDICMTNRNAVLAALDGFADRLSQARAAIANGQGDALHAMFEAGRRAKGQWRKP